MRGLRRARGELIAVAAGLAVLISLANFANAVEATAPTIASPKPPTAPSVPAAVAPKLNLAPAGEPITSFKAPEPIAPFTVPDPAANAGGARDKLRFEVPQLPNVTVAPSLRLRDLPPAGSKDILTSAPRDPRFNPTPGLKATIDLGDVTLDTKLNQPFKNGDANTVPGGPPTTDRAKVGVDMRLKF